MFWPGFVVGMGFLLIATGLTIAAWKVLEDHVDRKVYRAKEELGERKNLDVEFLKSDVKHLKESRDKAIDYRQELRDSIAEVEETVGGHRETIDRIEGRVGAQVGMLEGKIEGARGSLDAESEVRHERDMAFDKRIRELQDRIDYFIGISPVGGMLSAKITQTGIAIHKGTDKGAPFDGVTKIGDLVTIYEVKYVNDVQWAKIGDNQWICGGWRPRDPKKDLDPSTG